jgi:hypothetical protein
MRWAVSRVPATMLFYRLMFPAALAAQAPVEPRARNSIFVEAFGNTLYGGSLNYDRLVREPVSARIGVSPFGAGVLMGNYLYGNGGHRLEAGAGILVSLRSEPSAPGGLDGVISCSACETEGPVARQSLLGTATLGYRHQPPAGGAVLRAGLTPLIGRRGQIALWLGISVGYAF